ncbi:Retrovirus-related Pol polyprotein from transposon 17.6 [Trichinella patagoniensis]|uniref:RNA-directed DNA polymerase n=1 Tax=Trichinella patagoniensis TaxID=990121 RepID=A0A0V1A064_9BILA|nr:Retrovirus-related Pol polyprotein from transposon 17.6 [Trichinella patagoniensis]
MASSNAAKNETSSDISRLTSCLERMQLRLEDIEQRMQAFQPKQRDRRGDYATERAGNGQRPERRTCYRRGRDGGDVITTRKDPHPDSDLMAVVGKIDGCPTNILIDTGSAVTLVQSGIPTEPWRNGNLLAADGTHLTVSGKRWAKLEIGNQAFTHPVVIVENLVQQALLGRDFLRRFACRLNIADAVLQINGESVRLVEATTARSKVDVIIEEDVTLGPFTDCCVMARTTSADNCHGPWLLEQRPEGRLPVAVARAVVHPREGCVPVKLLNTSGDRVTIHRGKVVATIEVVDPLPLERSPKTHVALPPAIEKLLDEVAQRTTSEELDKLRALLTDFADVFSTYDGDLGRTTRTEHHINTGDAQPIRLCPRRIPWHFREQMDGLLTDMINKDIIEPSTSPWTAPVVLVKKKDGNVRFCVDFRKLNLVTKKDSYPLPRIDETIDTLAAAEWLSTLDLTSGYWQVPVAKEDREKTAFCTPKGLYQFKVMPFGLCNAPATFQRVMDLTLTRLKWKKCLVYLDDIVIFGRTFQEHFNNLEEVLQRIRQSGLKLKPAKCRLCAKEIAFLGHIVSRDGVRTDPSKTEKVASWPTPTSTSEVRTFLGFASYYRRFVKSWSNEAEEAFQRLKRALTTGQILAFPRFDIPFIIDTDASETGIGAVLSQKHDPEGERVIAYASRTLSKTERKYSTTRKELLSIGFTLRTDHDSLTWLRNFKEPEGQVSRWLEHLQEYDMEVVHRRGRQHSNADAMSRRPEVTEDNGDHPTTEMPSAAVGTAAVSLASNEGAEPLEKPQDENIECVIRFLSEWRELHKDSRDLVKQWKHLRLTPAGLAVVVTGKPARWVPPNHARLSILEQLHNGIGGDHLGVKKTAEKIRTRYFWPGWYRDVKAWCDRCEACARRKTPPIVNRAPMESIVVGNPMEIVAVDILGPVPRSKNGNSYIMVVTDYFTRWVEAYAVPNQQAETVARKLVQQFVCRFGTPMKLSDQETQFQGRLVTELCRLPENMAV